MIKAAGCGFTDTKKLTVVCSTSPRTSETKANVDNILILRQLLLQVF